MWMKSNTDCVCALLPNDGGYHRQRSRGLWRCCSNAPIGWVGRSAASATRVLERFGCFALTSNAV